jgi:quercetin dioxygenase-like cupin family protein
LVTPYSDKGDVRTFSEDVDSSELVWHRDRNDRLVTVLEGEGWLFQRDNELPKRLSVGDEIFIEAFTYHRILKGSTKLKIKIEE